MSKWLFGVGAIALGVYLFSKGKTGTNLVIEPINVRLTSSGLLPILVVTFRATNPTLGNLTITGITGNATLNNNSIGQFATGEVVKIPHGIVTFDVPITILPTFAALTSLTTGATIGIEGKIFAAGFTIPFNQSLKII
jgi:hypothetical protein